MVSATAVPVIVSVARVVPLRFRDMSDGIVVSAFPAVPLPVSAFAVPAVVSVSCAVPLRDVLGLLCWGCLGRSRAVSDTVPLALVPVSTFVVPVSPALVSVLFDCGWSLLDGLNSTVLSSKKSLIPFIWMYLWEAGSTPKQTRRPFSLGHVLYVVQRLMLIAGFDLARLCLIVSASPSFLRGKNEKRLIGLGS